MSLLFCQWVPTALGIGMLSLFEEKGRDEETSLQHLKALSDVSEEEIYLDPLLLVQGLEGPWLILGHYWVNCPGEGTRKGEGGHHSLSVRLSICYLFQSS